MGIPGADPVLPVDGVTNTGARYRRPAEDELPGARVPAPDLRGHNHSTRDPPWSAERHVADLLATLDAQGVGSALVVGRYRRRRGDHPRRARLMSGPTPTRRLAWASYGTAFGLAIGTVVGLVTGAEIAAALGAAVGAVGGVVAGRLRERRG